MVDFYDLHFDISGDTCRLVRDMGIECAPDITQNICEIQIAGENKDSHAGVKLGFSSEGKKLKYISHSIVDNILKIKLQSLMISACVVFEYIKNAYRIHTEIQNITAMPIVVEECSAFYLCGIGNRMDTDNILFTRFDQSHHAECQPKTISLADAGFSSYAKEGQTRLAFANVGSWSSKEQLPQGIIEHCKGCATMFQIECNSGWYYEISDKCDEYYLYLGGYNLPFHGWSKCLAPNDRYRTVNTVLTFGKDKYDVIDKMTEYRRLQVPGCIADENLPVVFNEYMHLSWDSPNERNTKKYAEYAAKAGADYYVIDCGWHNEEPGDKIYPYVGQWIESKARFPHGVRMTIDYIHSLGMKAGLWIEPEIIGINCKEMLDYYDDDCFMQRHGKRICVMNRYFLDFRNKKVRAYLTDTIRRMVEEYGADYIKCDYNEDVGAGTDYLAFCAAEGLEQCAAAYLDWVKEMIGKYPNVIFEGCASGGMRTDGKTLSAFSLVSTSDQIDCYKYPYIAGNMLSAIVPEQAAVWSYPISASSIEESEKIDRNYVENNITDDRVALNMINSFSGRMHLAGHLEWLSDKQMALVKEGISVYRYLTDFKKSATPYFPIGFTSFGCDTVAYGMKGIDRAYLAVYNLGGKCNKKIPTNYSKVEIVYPLGTQAYVKIDGKNLYVNFTAYRQAVFLKLRT